MPIPAVRRVLARQSLQEIGVTVNKQSPDGTNYTEVPLK
jgi:hypothetical protein